MTRARTLILEILSKAAEPLSAGLIYSRTAEIFDQATIYRNLHYLENNRMAESFVLHCAEHGTERYFTSCSPDSHNAHRHWFHCEKCHRFIDLGSCALDDLLNEYEKKFNFSVKSHTLNVIGICGKCS